MSYIQEDARVRFFKIFRILLIIGIFVVVDILLYRHFFQIHSYNGFINGSLYKVYPQDKGYLALGQWHEGSTVTSGTTLGRLAATSPASSEALPPSSGSPLKAPVSGIVYNVHANNGEFLQPKQPVMDILDCDQVWVDTFVDEKEVAKIDTQAPVEVHLLADEDAPPLSGEVMFLRYGAEQALNESAKGESVRDLAEWKAAQAPGQETVMKLKPYNLNTPKLALIRLKLQTLPPRNKNNFCSVGGKVEAVFKRL